MTLRLDPALPLVWRSPNELQLGASRPVLVLRDPGELESTVLALLARGASPDALRSIVSTLGIPADRLHALLEHLSPALEPAGSTADAAQRDAADPPVVAIDDAEPCLARAVAAALGSIGIRPVLAAHGPDRPVAVVLAAAWVVRPRAHLRWLRRDVAHLPVVHEGAAVRVGPLVVPGRSACLRCVELHRRDLDPAWPAIAAQLATHAAAPLPAAALGVAAAHAAAALDRFLGRGPEAVVGSSLSVPVSGAPPSRSPHPAHPDCGCRAPGGSATVPAPPAPPDRDGPSSAPAAGALG